MQAEFALEYNLLPQSYKPNVLETWLYAVIAWASMWFGRPTLDKMAAYFVARFTLGLVDSVVESIFDWLLGERRGYVLAY